MSSDGVQVTLTKADVDKIRAAFSTYLDELALAEMDDPEARRLVRRISNAIEEKSGGGKYRQEF